MKRDAFVSALETTHKNIVRVQNTAGVPPETLERWRKAGAKGCPDCRKVHCERYRFGLGDVGIVLGTTKAHPSYSLWYSLHEIVSRVHRAHRRWLDETGWAPLPGETNVRCNVFRHLAGLGEMLMTRSEPTREEVQALMYA